MIFKIILYLYYWYLPIPVAARSKVYDCSRLLAGIAASNPAGGMDVCLFWMLCFVT
jgi:hypothetical protein